MYTNNSNPYNILLCFVLPFFCFVYVKKNNNKKNKLCTLYRYDALYTVTSCYKVGIAEIARKWPFVIYTDCCGGFMYTEISKLFAPRTSFPVSVQEASSTELRVALLISL